MIRSRGNSARNAHSDLHEKVYQKVDQWNFCHFSLIEYTFYFQLQGIISTLSG